MNIRTLTFGLVLGALGQLAMTPPSVAADIDFEGLAAGQIIGNISSGNGISGDLKGSVEVFGFSPAFGAGTNAAVIFDSSCPPGGVPSDCTGRDDDLGTPNQVFGGPGVGAAGEITNDTPLGNVLIIGENLVDADNNGLVDDPDDADLVGMFYNFDFSKVKGGGTVTINSVTVTDIEQEEGEFGANIILTGPKIPTALISIPNTGDNGVVEITGIGVEGVRNMRIESNGSGSISAVTLNEELPRPCWITTGGFQNAGSQSGGKDFTFGGNVGPPPSGSWEVVDHNTGKNFHSNDVHIVECVATGGTGPQQPGGKKGFVIDKAIFEGTGRLRLPDGTSLFDLPFTGFVIDGGEPANKNGNDSDFFEIVVEDGFGAVVFEASGPLDGGNVQLHPPVGN